MKLTLNDSGDRYLIRSYEDAQITVNEAHYSKSLIVTPTKIINDWPPQSLTELTAEHLEQVAAQEPEVVILGTGSKQQFPNPQITEPLIRHGIGFEVMDTHAACRTYNVLMAENRRVAAALIIK